MYKRYIQPTVLVDVKTDDVLLKDEIFGPILSIVDRETIEQAVDYIRSKEKSLALYMFSQNSSRIYRVVKSVSSGAVVINNLIMHMACKLFAF